MKLLSNQLKLTGFGTIAHEDTQKIKTFLSKMNSNSGIIGVNALFLKVKTKVIELPKMPDEELHEALLWQIKDIIDGPPEEYITRYLKFPTASPDSKKMSLMVFTQKKEDLKEREIFLKNIGILPDFIEPEVAALRFSFSKTLGTQKDTPYAFLEIGHEHSFFAIFHKDNLLFFRPLNEISGSMLTKSIERDLNLTPEKALELKISYKNGREENREDPELKKLQNTIANFLTKISLEIQRSIDGYAVLRQDIAQPHRIFISGGGTYLAGFKEYLQTTLGFEVERFKSFDGLDTSNFKDDEIKKNEELYAIACGLALH